MSQAKLILVPTLLGLILYTMIIAVEDFLRPIGGAEALQFLLILFFGCITGSLLKSNIGHSYLMSIFSMFYAYGLLLAITFTVSLPRHLLAANLLFVITTLGCFYLADKYFNHLKLDMGVKLLVVFLGFPLFFTMLIFVR